MSIRIRGVADGVPQLLQKNSKLLAYLQLLRAPNVFTAIADIAMAYLVTATTMRGVDLVIILGATSLLYTAGMVLNDVFDYDVDLAERPNRPLPSGRISRTWAKWLGLEMLGGGVCLAWIAPLVAGVPASHTVRTGVLSLILAACILLYNAAAKKTIFGPLVMGSCRFLNILMGMSIYAVSTRESWNLAGIGATHLMIAGGIGMYITGVTVFARSEATVSARGGLVLGIAIMVAGVGLLASFPALFPDAYVYRIEPTSYWPIGLAVISIWIFRRCFAAVGDPQPQKVQLAVKFCLMSLIVLDATLTSLICPLEYGVALILLLLPTMFLGRWVYST